MGWMPGMGLVRAAVVTLIALRSETRPLGGQE
jgi:hypothetical protein